MTVGIVGLGLIGGSLAKAYKKNEGITVLGYDQNESTLQFAIMDGAVDDVLTDENIGQCDGILLAIYPQATLDFLEEKGDLISEKAIVMDTCGVKRLICEQGFKLAKAKHFRFVGGHPMAGKQLSGFKYSRATLFKGAPMVIVPENYNDLFFIDEVKKVLEPIGFSKVTVSTVEEHDERIAFTSQMPHLISNAFIKSPTAERHKGYSAGSYNDLTRVAYLNEDMWSELFLANREALLGELSIFMDALEKYKKTLEENDPEALKRLLAEGRMQKERIDGKCRSFKQS